MAGPSKGYYKRCRRLHITDLEDGRVLMEVTDPRLDGRIVGKYYARTEQDVARVKQSFMGRYRIPTDFVFRFKEGDPRAKKPGEKEQVDKAGRRTDLPDEEASRDEDSDQTTELDVPQLLTPMKKRDEEVKDDAD